MFKYSTGVGSYSYNSADAVCSKLVAITMTAMRTLAVNRTNGLEIKLNCSNTQSFIHKVLRAGEIFWYD
jgi:hypothetical protein